MPVSRINTTDLNRLNGINSIMDYETPEAPTITVNNDDKSITMSQN